jgi:hypothetical protein
LLKKLNKNQGACRRRHRVSFRARPYGLGAGQPSFACGEGLPALRFGAPLQSTLARRETFDLSTLFCGSNRIIVHVTSKLLQIPEVLK